MSCSPSSPHTEHDTTGHHLSSLANFWMLAPELQTRITLLACRSPEAGYERNPADRSLVALDFQTTLSLTLSSRALYALVTPILYANVRITRPSILADFLAAIERNPALGKLVRSLHLGPETHLPQHWWPVALHPMGTGDFPQIHHLATSLRDETLLPRWCCPARSWPLWVGSGTTSWRNEAVIDAITTAQRQVDVSLQRPRYNSRGHPIGSDEWLIRVMEVQAALDLYLVDMRRVEDAAGYPVERWQEASGPSRRREPLGPVIEYRKLVVLDINDPQRLEALRSAQQHALFLSRTELRTHISRRGSLADHFDHPFIFARSSLGHLAFGEGRQADMGVALAGHVDALYSEVEIEASRRNERTFADRLKQPLSSPAEARTTTIEGILDQAQRLLSYTPHLRHLYLSGYLQRIICGVKRPEIPLHSLKSLCLGPYSGFAPDCLAPTLQGLDLLDLEELRISGCVLANLKASTIAALPRLKRVDWDMAYANELRTEIFAAVGAVKAGLEQDSYADVEPLGKKRRFDFSDLGNRGLHDQQTPDGALEQPSSTTQTKSKTSRLVEISLQWELMDALLSTVGTEEGGRPRSESVSLCQEPHRLQLRPPGNSFRIQNVRNDGASREAEKAYQDASEWWEECAVGFEHHRPLPDYC